MNETEASCSFKLEVLARTADGTGVNYLRWIDTIG